MIRALLIVAALACKSAPPPEPEPARLQVFGEIQYLCKSGPSPARALQVDLRDREEPQLLATTVTSSTGRFHIETEPLGFQGGRFFLELAGEQVPVSGSTRLRYRVLVQLPCQDLEDRLPHAGVVSEVVPEDES
jgi:hypothetical protein